MSIKLTGDDQLHRYVAETDSHFNWKRIDSTELNGGALHRLQLISQCWQGILWRHRVDLFVPAKRAADSLALLTIGSDAPSSNRTDLDLELAANAGVVCAYLYDVPNQPLLDGRREDELIAYTMVRCLDTEDAAWLLLLPMVKSAVRCLDAIEACCSELLGLPSPGFVLHGASKRGWTTWLTAAVDRRVKGIMPEVYDNLNLLAQMPHQINVWSDYSEMIEDYTAQHLPERMATQSGLQLMKIVDPYSYRERLTLPKLLLHGANDRYWATDALNLYWDDLVGRKHICYAPNFGHYIWDRAAVRGAQLRFISSLAGGRPMPDPVWSFAEEGPGLKIEVRCDEPILEASVWRAGSDTLDFRDSTWIASSMTPRQSEGVWTARIARPASGCIAVFAQCQFASSGDPCRLTTQIRIVRA